MSFSIYMTGIVVCTVVIVITDRQLAAARTLSKRSPHEHNIHRHPHRRCYIEAIDQGSLKTLSNEVVDENKDSYGELRTLLKQAVCDRTRTSKRQPDDWLRLQDELNYEKCKNIVCFSEDRCDCCCVQASEELPRPQDASKENVMSLTGCICARRVNGTKLVENPQLYH